MLLNKKLISHVIWILLASILGISMSYLILLGGKYAYGAIYDTTTSQNIIVNTPLPPPEIKEVIKKVSQISIGFVGDIIPGISAPPNLFSDVKAHTEKILVGPLMPGIMSPTNPILIWLTFFITSFISGGGRGVLTIIFCEVVVS